MVRMEMKRSIGEALALLQFDEFGLPVNFASAILILLSCTANILSRKKKKRKIKWSLSGAAQERLLTSKWRNRKRPETLWNFGQTR